MILTPFNSTNPYLWGREIKLVVDGRVLNEPTFNIPNEFDFFKEWCEKDPINAQKYYA
jgi:hypothetical protein